MVIALFLEGLPRGCHRMLALGVNDPHLSRILDAALGLPPRGKRR